MPNSKKSRYRYIAIARTNGINTYSIEGRIPPNFERILLLLLRSWKIKLTKTRTIHEKPTKAEEKELDDFGENEETETQRQMREIFMETTPAQFAEISSRADNLDPVAFRKWLTDYMEKTRDQRERELLEQ